MSEFKAFYIVWCPELSDLGATKVKYENMESASAAAEKLAKASRFTVFVTRAMQKFETEVKVKLSSGK